MSATSRAEEPSSAFLSKIPQTPQHRIDIAISKFRSTQGQSSPLQSQRSLSARAGGQYGYVNTGLIAKERKSKGMGRSPICKSGAIRQKMRNYLGLTCMQCFDKSGSHWM